MRRLEAGYGLGRVPTAQIAHQVLPRPAQTPPGWVEYVRWASRLDALGRSGRPDMSDVLTM
jgi:hypothetical protein